MSRRIPVHARTVLSIAGRDVRGLGEVVLVLLAAHAVSLPEFGRFALVLAAAGVLVTVNRTLAGEPLRVHTGLPPGAVGGAVALSLLIGVTAGAVVTAACAILSSGPLLALAPLLPGLLLHDCLRHLALRRRRAGLVLVSDAVCAVGQLVAVVAVVWVGDTNGRDLVLAWGTPAWLAATVLVVPLGAVPRPTRMHTWIHVSRHGGRRFLGAVVGPAGATQAALYLTGALAGLGAAGQLALARALFGPPRLVANGIGVLGGPASGGRSAALRSGGVAALWTVGLLLAPTGPGRALAGPAWPELTALIWIVGAREVLESLRPGRLVPRPASGRDARTSAVRAASALLAVTVAAALAGGFGAGGAAVGLLAGSALASACWWGRHLIDPRRAGTASATSTAGVDRPACHLVSHSYPDSGAAGILSALAEHLRVTLVTPHRAADGPDPDCGYRTLGFARLPRRGPAYLLGSLRLGMAARPEFVVIEYDPWLPTFWQALLAAKLYGGSRVFVATRRNTLRPVPARLATTRRLLTRAALRHTEGVLAASQPTARLYEREFGCPSARIRVLTYLAVDTRAFRPAGGPAPVDRLRIGFVGRFDRRGGGDTLLRAFALAREQVPRAELHLMGLVAPDLGDQIARLRLRGGLRVRPLLATDQVAEFLRGLDVFVLPTAKEPDHEEEDGIELLRAMATGLPCVGSDSGIIPELLFPDGGPDNGLLFAAGDHLGLAEDLLRLAKDPDLRSGLGANAREFALRTASLRTVARARATALTGHRSDPVPR
ncbi:MAG TPA: glycosyltransferase [Mycobacteriales bacterium]|nr:glycosyltransferase [Mycobacteriales bacterium]